MAGVAHRPAGRASRSTATAEKRRLSHRVSALRLLHSEFALVSPPQNRPSLLHSTFRIPHSTEGLGSAGSRACRCLARPCSHRPGRSPPPFTAAASHRVGQPASHRPDSPPRTVNSLAGSAPLPAGQSRRRPPQPTTTRVPARVVRAARRPRNGPLAQSGDRAIACVLPGAIGKRASSSYLCSHPLPRGCPTPWPYPGWGTPHTHAKRTPAAPDPLGPLRPRKNVARLARTADTAGGVRHGARRRPGSRVDRTARQSNAPPAAKRHDRRQACSTAASSNAPSAARPSRLRLVPPRRTDTRYPRRLLRRTQGPDPCGIRPPRPRSNHRTETARAGRRALQESAHRPFRAPIPRARRPARVRSPRPPFVNPSRSSPEIPCNLRARSESDGLVTHRTPSTTAVRRPDDQDSQNPKRIRRRP